MEEEEKLTKTLEIKLVDGKMLIPFTYDNPPKNNIYVEFSIGDDNVKSSSKSFEPMIIWNELFSLTFAAKEKEIYVKSYVDVEKKKILIGFCKIIIKGRRSISFIKNIPVTFVDYHLKKTRKSEGKITFSLTAKDFGYIPIVDLPQKSSSVKVTKKHKLKSFIGNILKKPKKRGDSGPMSETEIRKSIIEIDNEENDDIIDVENIPRIVTEHKAQKMKVHETPCYYDDECENFAGYYSGKILPFKNRDSDVLLPVGFGLMKLPGKMLIYNGEYKMGKRDGRGVMYSVNDKKICIKCFWVNDIPEGKCEIFYQNGDCYYGNVLYKGNNINFSLKLFHKDGIGSFISRKRGFCYFGGFKNDKRDGIGIIDYFSTGDRYIGNWKDDFYSGTGCYVNIDGSIYFGKYKNGNKFGIGQYYLSNGYEIKGEWVTGGKDNVLSKMQLFEGKYEYISENVLKMIDLELKKSFIRKNTKRDEKRSLRLWSSIIDREEIETQLDVFSFSYSNFYKKFDKNICFSLLEDSGENGYVNSIIDIFCEYFRSFYSVSSEFNLKNKLLYAKDDVSTFLNFVQNEFYKILQIFGTLNTPHQMTSSDFINEKDFERQPVQRSQSHGNFISKSHMNSVGSFTKEVDHRNSELQNDQKKVINFCFMNYVNQKIYPILFKLYKTEYKEQEALLKQKIKSIQHALEFTSNEKKIEMLKIQLNYVKPKEEYEKLEISALKSLLKSMTDSLLRSENEKDFLLNYLKCVNLKLTLLQQQNKQIYEKFSISADDILNCHSNGGISKTNLIELENKLKIIRIGLNSTFQFHKIKSILSLISVLEDNKSTFNKNYLSSYKNQCNSLLLNYEYLLDNISKERVDFVHSVENFDVLRPITLAMDAVIIDIDSFSLPSYLQMYQLKKSVSKRIESLILILKSSDTTKHKKLITKLESCNIGTIEDIQKKSMKIYKIISKKSESLPEYFIERWKSVYRCQQVQYKPDSNTFRFMDMTSQIKSVSLELQNAAKIYPFCSVLFKSIEFLLKSIMDGINNVKTVDDVTKNVFAFLNLKKRCTMIITYLTYWIDLVEGEETFNFFFNILQNSQVSFEHFIEQCTISYFKAEISTNIKDIERQLNVQNLQKIVQEKLEKDKRTLEEGLKKYFEKNDKKNMYEKIKILESIRTLEFGVRAIEISFEQSEVLEKYTSIRDNLCTSELKTLLAETNKKMRILCLGKKINTIENGINGYKLMKKNLQIRLESFGISEKFIPRDFNKSPYQKTIKLLNKLKEKKSLCEKFEVLGEFEKSLQKEMKKVSGKKNLEEDEILPISLYIFLKADLNHYAEYNYMNDWKIEQTKMLLRYDVFFKYVQNLDPYLKTSQGELLSVLGNIIDPIKSSILKLTNENKEFNIRFLINLFNFIYCEIGYLKGKHLEIREVDLKKNILENLDNAKLIIQGNLGMDISIDPIHNRLMIEFKNKYSPNIYKYIASEILREFKDFL